MVKSNKYEQAKIVPVSLLTDVEWLNEWQIFFLTFIVYNRFFSETKRFRIPVYRNYSSYFDVKNTPLKCPSQFENTFYFIEYLQNDLLK